MTKPLLLFTFFTLSLLGHSFAQFVQISPANPGPDDTVRVVFDAALGDQRLKGCGCDVYLISGLVQGSLSNMSPLRHIQGGQGKADPQLKMTPLGEDKYQYELVPRAFYGLASDEEFLQMSFAFQNIDGSIQHLNAEALPELYPSLTYLANQALDDASGKDGLYMGNTKTMFFDPEKGYRFLTDEGEMHLQFMDHGIVKVSFLPTGTEVLPPSEVVQARPAIEEVTMEERESAYVFLYAESYTLSVNKSPLRLSWSRSGEELLHDQSGFYLDAKDETVGTRFTLSPEEHIYGTGSRALPIDRRGMRFNLFHSAVYGYSAGEPTLNISLPIYVSSKRYAVYFDNDKRGYFDLGKSEQTVLEYGTMDTQGLTYYLIPGYDYGDVVKGYTYLTGRQPLPPKWALGYIQSRYGYKTQDEAMRMVDTLQQAGFPLDALVLDLFWFGDKEQMGQLDWNKEQWPDPKGMIQAFQKKGVQLITISEPYFIQGSRHYAFLDSMGYFTRNSEGDTYVIENFWAGPASLLDIFNPAAKEWVWKQYKARIDEGVSGLWVDLTEPENHPVSMQHILGSAEEVHNRYPNEWNRNLFQYFRKNYPRKRLFNLSRAGFAGMQAHATFPWSGDISRSWDGLAIQPAIMLSQGLCGIGYMHSDLGGFTGGEMDQELYTRWLQFGTFVPVMRAHGAFIPSEPIFYSPETQHRVRDAISLRYQLFPYNYTLSWENTTHGSPLVRPLFYHYPNDPSLAQEDSAYLWGRDLLVCPILRQGQKEKLLYLPKEAWIDFRTDSLYSGGETHSIPLSLDQIPLFVRGGAILPMTTPHASLSGFHADTLIFHYYPVASRPASSATLYLDDGQDAASIQHESCSLWDITAMAQEKQLTLDMHHTGKGYVGASGVSTFLFEIHRIRGKVKKVSWNQKKLKAVSSLQELSSQKNSVFHDKRNNRLYIHGKWQNGDSKLEIKGKGMLY